MRAAGWGVVLKILITGVIGGVAYFITNLVHQAQIWTLTMSIFIGGVALVVQFLFDVETRLAQTQELVDRRFGQVSEATELFRKLDDPPLNTTIGLARNASRISVPDGSLLGKLVQAELLRTSRFLGEVANRDDPTCSGSEHDWLFALVKHATRNIKATSAIADGKALVDEGFWTSQEARTYLDLQQAAVAERGVSIRRIFIQFEENQLDKPEFRQVLERNLAAQVEVRVLAPLGPTGGPVSAGDFVLFDEEISYELTSASFPGNETMVQSTTLVLDAEHVRRRDILFEALWTRATPYGTGARKRRFKLGVPRRRQMPS